MRRIDNSSSQDGIETTSITSSVESEIRRPSKTKRSSIKRKIPNFKDDSDDTVNEPLLQSENDVSEFKQSAKFVSSKSKTDSTNGKSDNTSIGTKVKTSPTTSTFSENVTIKGVTTDIESASTSVTASIHNYMNTNVFGAIDTSTSKTTKSSLIVEIESTKSSYSPSPLIFTTAKIHTHNKIKEMEPLHVTPVPILSTIEGNVIKSIPSTIDSGEKHYDTVKSKSESQKKCIQENEQSIITNASNIKQHSTTVSPNIKTTVVSSVVTKPLSGQSTKQTSFDKPLIVQTDSKIPVTSSKVEKANSTSSTNTKLQDKNTRTATADNTKKNVQERDSAERSKLEIQETPSKKQNDKQSFLMDESQKQTSNGVTPQILSLSAKKAAILTSSNNENTPDKEKDPKSGSSVPMNKQLQRQKKTVDDTCISDAKNRTIVCDPKVNISKEVSAGIPVDKAKSAIIKPTMPKMTSDSQNALTMLPTKSGASMSANYSAVSDKPIFVSSVPKETANTTDNIEPVTSLLPGKGKKVDKTSSLISEPIEKKNISDKSDSSTSVPKGKVTTSDKSLTSLTAVKANSTDKSKTVNKTSPLTSVPSGKANNIDKPGSLNSTSTGKTNTADKYVSSSSVPVVKTNPIDKPSSLPSASMTTAKISNKPDSLSFMPAVSPNTSIKPGPVASATSVKPKSKEKSPLMSASKGTANVTAKPGSLSTDKANTAGKISSGKSAPSEQTNTVISGSKISVSITKSSRNDPVTTTSGPLISKSANNVKSSGKESVAEVKKVSEKTKSKVSPTLKSEIPIGPSESKAHKGVPTSVTTDISSNVVTTIAKKIGNETNATTSSTATPSIKGSTVSNLPSSSTSAKILIGKTKNNEPMSSENNKDSRA
ncbi:PREDICTED: mucin-5AC-like isoform X1 [Papilio polytes]|uniref:mucin-5AC-like isoform X1 n=1 Tax=Papilio polytes TaxID=76194 RepID=UPI00067628F1|nr:PREDICTED: mucin-5AC-like isoform X1 [Papilio polytes]